MIAQAAGDLALLALSFIGAMCVIGAIHRWWYR